MNDGTNSDSSRCVTQASSLGVTYGDESSRMNSAAKQNVICDDTQVAEEITIGVNTITNDTQGDCYHLATFQATSSNIDAYLLESDETLQNNVNSSGDDLDRAAKNTAGCTQGTDNGIARLLGVMPMNLEVTKDTVGLQIKFNNTRALNIDMSDSTDGHFFKWDMAFFDFELTAVE